MPATPHSSCGVVGMIDEDLLYTIILGKGLVFVLVVVSCAAVHAAAAAFSAADSDGSEGLGRMLIEG